MLRPRVNLCCYHFRPRSRDKIVLFSSFFETVHTLCLHRKPSIYARGRSIRGRRRLAGCQRGTILAGFVCHHPSRDLTHVHPYAESGNRPRPTVSKVPSPLQIRCKSKPPTKISSSPNLATITISGGSCASEVSAVGRPRH